jgi:hypothetical protein
LSVDSRVVVRDLAPEHPARRYDLGTCSLDLESLLTFDYENEPMTIRMDVQRQFESRLPIGAED